VSNQNHFLTQKFFYMKKTLKALFVAGAFFFAAPLVSNAALVPGQVITINLSAAQSAYLTSIGYPYAVGQTFTFVVMQEPDPSDGNSIEALEAVADAQYTADLEALGIAFQNDYTLQYLAPVDLGLTAVLGAGAIAAVKRARNKRKQATIA
jgi:hypothetical protein